MLTVGSIGCSLEQGTPASNAEDKGLTSFACEQLGLLADGVCDRICGDADPVCLFAAENPLFAIASPGSAAKLPVVLAHGMGGSSHFLAFHDDIVRALEADGHTVLRAEVPPFASVAVRARALGDFIDASNAPRVHIIAHSMGGLDARYLISSLGYGDRVATLTTISTPHRGSLLADTVLPILDFGGAAAEALANDFLAFAGEQFSDHAETADVRATMEALSTAGTALFNEANPNDDRVYYQSYAGVGNLTGKRPAIMDEEVGNPCFGFSFLHPGTYGRISVLLVAKIPLISSFGEKPFHDALVSVDSSAWGDFRGCIPTDHALEIGGLLVPHVEEDRGSGFDPINFYRTIVFDLASRE